MLTDTIVETDGHLLDIQVEVDHAYVHCEQCGCGDELENLSEIRRLRDSLTELIARRLTGSVGVSQR